MKHIVGVDISQGSVDIYNKKAAEQGFSSEMEAVCAVLKGEPGELGGAKFDLITVRPSPTQAVADHRIYKNLPRPPSN